MAMSDIDVVEINEAFAAQIVPCKEQLDIPDEKLNPFGGAIALGHPFGMTGARIMTTLINDLETLDGTTASSRCASPAAWAWRCSSNGSAESGPGPRARSTERRPAGIRGAALSAEASAAPRRDGSSRR